MKLILYPDPILSKMCEPISSPNALIIPKRKYNKIRFAMANAMWKIMHDNKGMGLAAPQVGLDIRMFVWKENKINRAIWNPVLTKLEGETESIEGCLSLPGVNVLVKRAASSNLRGIGLYGERILFVGDSIVTRIWQHEIDHLDGKLITENTDDEDEPQNGRVIKSL